MTSDYFREFEQALGSAPNKRALHILEIGCADGFFLSKLKQAGYRSLQGIEPGREAVARAPESVRPLILNDFFESDTFPAESFDVVCCFQVMDHLPDPASTMNTIRQILKPDGMFIAINHDVRAPITRIIGERSPMYDVEHIYLFDRSTISQLLQNSGFRVVDSRRLRNAYTLDYALKMFPLPAFLKRVLGSAFAKMGVASWSIRVPAGNMITVGRRA